MIFSKGIESLPQTRIFKTLETKCLLRIVDLKKRKPRAMIYKYIISLNKNKSIIAYKQSSPVLLLWRILRISVVIARRRLRIMISVTHFLDNSFKRGFG